MSTPPPAAFKSSSLHAQLSTLPLSNAFHLPSSTMALLLPILESLSTHITYILGLPE